MQDFEHFPIISSLIGRLIFDSMGISLCGIFPMGILHVWILHIGIFPVWIIPVWQTGLRHLIDVELRADHSALIISATVTDKVAVFLKFLKR